MSFLVNHFQLVFEWCTQSFLVILPNFVKSSKSSLSLFFNVCSSLCINVLIDDSAKTIGNLSIRRTCSSVEVRVSLNGVVTINVVVMVVHVFSGGGQH